MSKLKTTGVYTGAVIAPMALVGAASNILTHLKNDVVAGVSSYATHAANDPTITGGWLIGEDMGSRALGIAISGTSAFFGAKLTGRLLGNTVSQIGVGLGALVSSASHIAAYGKDHTYHAFSALGDMAADVSFVGGATALAALGAHYLCGNDKPKAPEASLQEALKEASLQEAPKEAKKATAKKTSAKKKTPTRKKA